MKSSILKKAHKYAAVCALLLIVTFFTSSVVVDLWGDLAMITRVKQAIWSCVLLLVIAMMTTGITAKKLYKAKPKGIFAKKELRMKVAAANGVIILLPAAYFLAVWSANGQFDQVFWTVQIIELIAGFINAVLIGLNIRDGIRLGQKRPTTNAG
ncbi:hypothetical protein ACQKP8_22175 [Photobacterium alginatilyticum]|uniref:hypothetical protein n=1 Tax=Photobacterium alginatilyticum TaxID=1775171 RepID=UPI00406897EF